LADKLERTGVRWWLASLSTSTLDRYRTCHLSSQKSTPCHIENYRAMAE